MLQIFVYLVSIQSSEWVELNCINHNKSPYKHRFIASFSKYMTKDLSCLFTKLLSTIKDGLMRYCNTRMWIMKNSTNVLSSLMECINRQYSATVFVSCSLRIRYHSVTVFIVGFVIWRDTISVNIDHDFSSVQIVTSMIWCFDFSFMNCPILLFCFSNFPLYFRTFVPDIMIYILWNYWNLMSLVWIHAICVLPFNVSLMSSISFNGLLHVGLTV